MYLQLPHQEIPEEIVSCCLTNKRLENRNTKRKLFRFVRIAFCQILFFNLGDKNGKGILSDKVSSLNKKCLQKLPRENQSGVN